MLRNFLKNRKAQNTAEYALLIALVVAAIIAMQTYAQRALQARVYAASQYMATTDNAIGNATQYEPYYLTSNYDVDTSSKDKKLLGSGLVGAEDDSNRTRTGNEVDAYTTTDIHTTQ